MIGHFGTVGTVSNLRLVCQTKCCVPDCHRLFLNRNINIINEPLSQMKTNRITDRLANLLNLTLTVICFENKIYEAAKHENTKEGSKVDILLSWKYHNFRNITIFEISLFSKYHNFRNIIFFRNIIIFEILKFSKYNYFRNIIIFEI